MAGSALCIAGPVYAQDALDRTDPVQAEKRDRSVPPAESVGVSVGPSPVHTSQATGTIEVGAIELHGLEATRNADYAHIVAEFLGQTQSQQELATLTDRLAERARQKGYIFASAHIEPQTLRAGVLRVRLNEGRIDAVRVEGYESRAIHDALAPLVSGRPVTLEELERRLLIAGDIDGVRVARSRYLFEEGRCVLIVKTMFNQLTAFLTLDNDSTKPIGPIELLSTVQRNGVLADDDSLNIALLNTPLDPTELAYGRLRYTKRLNPSGTEVSLTTSYSHTAPGSYIEPLHIRGESVMTRIAARHPLLRRRDESLWFETSLEARRSMQEKLGELAREDRLTIARAGLFGFRSFLGGHLRASGEVSRGLGILDATQLGDPLASRRDADGTFTSFAGSVDWTRPLWQAVSANIAVRSQISSAPLLSSQEIGIGGARFLRGYDYSERAGDRGAMASAELRYAHDSEIGPVSRTQFYVYGDAGRVENLEGGNGTGTLYSAGAGVRADINKRLDASLELAVPLSGERYDTGNASPRIRFSITRYFVWDTPVNKGR